MEMVAPPKVRVHCIDRENMGWHAARYLRLEKYVFTLALPAFD